MQRKPKTSNVKIVQAAKKGISMTEPAIYYSDDWTKLRVQLNCCSEASCPSNLFWGYIPDGYLASAHRILYVCPALPDFAIPLFGKGPNPLQSDPLALDFVRSLGALAGGADPLDSVAITTVCKLAPSRDAIDAPFLLAQQQLAVQTLRYELFSLQPKLVVFGCSGPFSALIRETVNAVRGSAADFQKDGEGTAAFLYRERDIAAAPAVMVVQPPNAFPKSSQAPWLARAAALLQNKQ